MRCFVYGTALAILLFAGCTSSDDGKPTPGTKLYTDGQATQFKMALSAVDFSKPKGDILKEIGVDKSHLKNNGGRIDGRVVVSRWQLSPSYILVEFEGGTDLKGATIRIDKQEEQKGLTNN